MGSRGEFDLEKCVSAGQVFRWKSEKAGVWRGVDGENWYEVGVDEGERGVRYEVLTGGDRASFEDLFHLNRDVAQELLAMVEGDRDWEGLISRQAGLRLMKPSCVVEEMFSFLCTSNNHLKRIIPMVERLAAYGEFRTGGWHRFPTLEVIAGIGEDALRSAGFGYRGKTIPLAARGVLDRGGLAWLEGLRSVSYGEAFESLVGLAGVGPKLADCICLFALGHGDAVPVDTHIWQQATARFFPEWRGLAVTEKRYRAVGDLLRGRFGCLAGAAHQMMFHESLRGRRD